MIRAPRRAHAGFTMIEVMVALLLTAIATSGIVGLFMVQTRASGFSRHTTEATVLGQDELERLRTTNATGGSTSPVGGINELGVNPGMFDRTSTVTAVGAVVTHYDMQVVVSWTEDGVSRSVTLSSRRTP